MAENTLTQVRRFKAPAPFWSLVALVLCLLASVATAAAPRGYYVFRPALGRIDLEVPWMRSANIEGVILRDTWGNVEPVTGQFNWQRLDTACKRAAELGKKIQLEVLAGPKAPEWTGGDAAQYNEAFVKAYESMCAAAGAKLSQYPITAVHCTLPSSGSAEFSKPPAELTQSGWQTKALAANHRALAAWAKAFPNAVVVINLHNPTGVRDGFVNLQVKLSHELLGKRGALQYNAWNAKTSSRNYNLFVLCQKNSLDGYPTGLEQVSDSSKSRYGGAWAQGLENAAIANPDYLIIYAPDAAKVNRPWVKK